jgi:hypothetical protein
MDYKAATLAQRIIAESFAALEQAEAENAKLRLEISKFTNEDVTMLHERDKRIKEVESVRDSLQKLCGAQMKRIEQIEAEREAQFNQHEELLGYIKERDKRIKELEAEQVNVLARAIERPENATVQRFKEALIAEVNLITLKRFAAADFTTEHINQRVRKAVNAALDKAAEYLRIECLDECRVAALIEGSGSKDAWFYWQQASRTNRFADAIEAMKEK